MRKEKEERNGEKGENGREVEGEKGKGLTLDLITRSRWFEA